MLSYNQGHWYRILLNIILKAVLQLDPSKMSFFILWNTVILSSIECCFISKLFMKRVEYHYIFSRWFFHSNFYPWIQSTCVISDDELAVLRSNFATNYAFAAETSQLNRQTVSDIRPKCIFWIHSVFKLYLKFVFKFVFKILQQMRAETTQITDRPNFYAQVDPSSSCFDIFLKDFYTFWKDRF